MSVSFGFVVGFVAWFIVRYLLAGLYTVDQNERAVKTVFGRAQRLHGEATSEDPIAQSLTPRSGNDTSTRSFASSSPAARTSSGRGKGCTRSRWRRER